MQVGYKTVGPVILGIYQLSTQLLKDGLVRYLYRAHQTVTLEDSRYGCVSTSTVPLLSPRCFDSFTVVCEYLNYM